MLIVFSVKPKIHIIKNRILLFLILISELISFSLLYYFRYKNQNLALTGFENKAGNIVSAVLYLLISLMVIVNIFSSRKISVSYLWFILFVSIAASFALTAAGFLIQKEIRIVLSSVFIITNFFLFSALAVITFSSNLKAVFLKSLLVFVILFFAGMTYIFICVLSFSDDSETYITGDGKADAGVILGAAVWGGNRPSPVLRDRINKGYDIYIKGAVPKLVITGGGSPNEMTEAEVSKNALIKYGVDSQNLIVENESNSTVEQIHFVRDKLYKKRNWKKIVIISDNFHLMRSKEICSFNDIKADCIATDKSYSTEGNMNYYLKESFALIIFWMCGI